MAQRTVPRERIEEATRKAVAEVLGCAPEEVGMDQSLVRDLGAHSLDCLDIRFDLEQALGIETAKHSVLEHAEEIWGKGAAIDDRGMITDAGARLLERRLGVDCRAETKRGLDDLPKLLTPRALAREAKEILDTLPEQCPCGAREWTSGDGKRIFCGTCQAPAPLKSGDEILAEWVKDASERHGRI